MTAPGATRPAHLTSTRRRASFPDAVRSEWIKFRSLRSSWITVVVAVLLGAGLGILISHLAADHYATSGVQRFAWDPTKVSLSALGIAQLAVSVLGALVVTSEYGTGSIRTSLAAVPRRGRLLAAKALVLVVVMLVTGEVIAFVAFLGGQAAIGGAAPHTTLAAPHVARAVVGAGLYLAAIGLLSSAVGWVVRNTAAAISAMVALLFVLPGVIFALPTWLEQPLNEYWPTNAGQQVYNVSHGAHALGAWAGFGVLAAFAALVLLAGRALLGARDA